jgi:hypothetical protein
MRDPPNEMYLDVQRKLVAVVVLLVSMLLLMIGRRTFARVYERKNALARDRLAGR